jgi:hypothetical protein
MAPYVGKNRRDLSKKKRSKTFKNIPKTQRGLTHTLNKIPLHPLEPTDWNSSDDEAEPEDEYGVEVTRRHIRLPPTVKFEDHEIGVRQTYDNDKLIPSGTDAFPNPEKFYIEQQPGGSNHGYRIAQLKEGDFDEDIIKAHGLHPRFGIRLPDSVNPDRDELENPWFPPPTDWSQPLPIPKSQRVVETFADGSRKLFHSNRNWIQEVDAQWEAHGAKVKMWQLLETNGDLKTLFPGVPKKALTKMKLLAEACKEAEGRDKKLEAEAKARAKADYERRLVREAEAVRFAAATSVYPSSSAYDPVRDTTYQTPYPRTVPPPRPAQHAPYRRGTSLATLADVAEHPPPHMGPVGRSLAPNAARLPSMVPSRSWAEPPTMPSELPPSELVERALHLSRLNHIPQPGYEYRPLGPPPPAMTAPQQMGLAPNNNFLPPTAPPPPPQSRGGNNSLRPLQPAPPRGGRRTTPPQPSPSNRGGWYGK